MRRDRCRAACKIARRRTFAIISHPDAGKTTLTEKLLLFGGAIQLAGAVKARGEHRRARVGLDEGRARARHLGHHVGDDVRLRRLHVQPARHARPRGFLRGHLPHADRRRLGGDGDRRRQGHRDADAQAVRGLPPARRADHHLHQQDGPRRPRPVRAARRDRARACSSTSTPASWPIGMGREFRGCYDLLADQLHADGAHASGETCRRASPSAGSTIRSSISCCPSARSPSCARTSRWCAGCARRSTSSPIARAI